MATDRQFGQFSLEGTIAVGRDVETWRAVWTTPAGAKKHVALKRLRKGLVKDSEGAKRFLAEAGRAASLVNPNIVQVFDYGEIDGVQYVAQELVDGPSLAHVLKRAAERKEPIVPFPVALFIASEICRGLQVAHQRQLVHGDVSPENVLISWTGRVKLGDFGMVRALPRVTEPVKGRQRYLPPESLGLGPSDPRFDLFNVGVLLYFMLCGRLPFSGSSEDVARRIVAGEFAKPRAVNPDLTDELDELVTRALSLKKGFPNAQMLQELLGELFQGSFPGVATNWVGAYLAVFFGDELTLAGRKQSLPQNVVGAIQAVRTSHSTQRLAPVGDSTDATSFELPPVPAPSQTMEPLEPDEVPATDGPTGPRNLMPAEKPSAQRLSTATTMQKKPPLPWARVGVGVGAVLVTLAIGYVALKSSLAPKPVPPPVKVEVEDWRTPLKRRLAIFGKRPMSANQALAFRPLLDEVSRKLVDVIDDERADAEREVRFLDAAIDGEPVPAREVTQYDSWLVLRAKALVAEDQLEPAISAVQGCPSCINAKQAATELTDDRQAFAALLDAERAMVANDYATAREKLQVASDARFFRARYDKAAARYLEVSGATNPPADFFVQPLKEKLGLPKRLARIDNAMRADPVLGYHHRRAWTEVSTQTKSATSQRATLEAAAALDALEATLKGKK